MKIKVENIIKISVIVFLILMLVGIIYFTRKEEEQPKSKDNFSNNERQFVNSPKNISGESWKYPEPKIIKNLLSEAECRYIIEKAKPQLERSSVMGSKQKEYSKDRTSRNTFIYKSDPVVKDLMNRISDLINFPVENFEDLQVVNYGVGQQYKPHYDACIDDSENCKNDYKIHGKYRIWTVFIYLNDDFVGGETIFPNIGMEVKLAPGDGVLFYNLNETEDGASKEALHGGAPVHSGEKWGCNIWVRQGKF